MQSPPFFNADDRSSTAILVVNNSASSLTAAQRDSVDNRCHNTILAAGDQVQS